MTMALETNQTEHAVIAAGPSSPSSYRDDTFLVAASGNPDVSAADDVLDTAGWAFTNRCSRSVFTFAVMGFRGTAAHRDEKEPDAASGDRCFVRPLHDVEVLASYSVTRLTLHSLGETRRVPVHRMRTTAGRVRGSHQRARNLAVRAPLQRPDLRHNTGATCARYLIVPPCDGRRTGSRQCNAKTAWWP